MLLTLTLSCFLVEAVVEFDYEAQQDDELTLTVGDIIKNIRQDDGGWWEGELGGHRGLFPDNFVRVSKGLFFVVVAFLLCRPTEDTSQTDSCRYKQIVVAFFGILCEYLLC